MKKIIGLVALFSLLKCSAVAQALKESTINVSPKSSGGKCYISLQKGDAFAESEAISIKNDIDLVYHYDASGNSIKKEFYNMNGKNIKLPEGIIGTQTGIVALTWDKDLVDKCRTVADLKRMTGSYTANSFSSYGTFANNTTGAIDYRYYLVRQENGKMGVLEISNGEKDMVVVKLKMEP